MIVILLFIKCQKIRISEESKMNREQIREEIKKTNNEINKTSSPLRKNDLYPEIKEKYINYINLYLKKLYRKLGKI